jgi:hypothetical protein
LGVALMILTVASSQKAFPFKIDVVT